MSVYSMNNGGYFAEVIRIKMSQVWLWVTPTKYSFKKKKSIGLFKQLNFTSIEKINFSKILKEQKRKPYRYLENIFYAEGPGKAKAWGGSRHKGSRSKSKGAENWQEM